MPTDEEILLTLTAIANDAWTLAAIWHVLLAVFLLRVGFGWRPTRRLAASFLVLPLLSVSGAALWSGNPFNACACACQARWVINEYFRDELKWETDPKYNIWGDVQPWRRDDQTNTGEMLREAMTQNPYLRVLVLAAYYDGATDYFGAQYTMSHLDPSGTIKDRVSFAFYESGIMMYVRKSDLAKSKQDLKQFVAVATAKGTASPTTTASRP
jgi:hypothetical protein